MRRGLINCFQFRWNMLPPSSVRKVLLRIKFDDQLFLDRFPDLRPAGERLDRTAEVLPVQLQPGRDPLADHRIQRLVDGRVLAALFQELDPVPGADEEGRNIHLAPPHQEMAVPDHLAALPPGHREPELVDDVVQTALQKDQQIIAGLALHPIRFFENIPELLFQEPVDPLGLLLLPQLNAIIAVLGTSLTVLAGGISPPLDGALVGEATVSFQVEFDTLSPAEPAYRLAIPGQILSSSFSVPPWFTRGAASAGGIRCAGAAAPPPCRWFSLRPPRRAAPRRP